MSDSSQTVISCQGLVAGYGGRPILNGVDLEIRRGDITVLLGGSGSGKSTLLKTLVGLLPPLRGRVNLLGHDLYAIAPSARATLLRRTGMLFQQGALFGSETVLDNIALPLREQGGIPDAVIEEAVLVKLALVGLESLRDRLPSEISGGQRKRVGLLRATILDPELLFADEPSAGLDPIAAAGLDELLRSFQRLFGMTMVVVTHELESIKQLADRVIMLAEGRVLAEGGLRELQQSSIPAVVDFFSRRPPRPLQEGRPTSVLAAMQHPAGEPARD